MKEEITELNGATTVTFLRPLVGVETETTEDLRVAFGTVQLMRLGRELPAPGKSLHVLTGGNIDLLCFLEWIIRIRGRAGCVFMSVWSIALRDILMLERWHAAGLVGSVELVCGDFFPSKSKKEWALLEELQRRGVFRCSLAHIHAKVLLCEANDKIVVEGSANCNMNPRIEQACVTVSETLYSSYLAYFRKMTVEDTVRGWAKEMAKEVKRWRAGG